MTQFDARARQSDFRYDAMGLSETRDELALLELDPQVQETVLKIVDDCRSQSMESKPLRRLQALLDQLRALPRCDERVRLMHTLVATLGKPENLAAYLDALRLSLESDDEHERDLALKSVAGRMHAAYGWGGQTAIIYSSPEATVGTTPPLMPDLEVKFRRSIALWWMSIHIWQPNANATGFPSAKPPEPDLWMEPPHSHPFDFLSMVSVGEMHQSIYERADGTGPHVSGRYDDVPLDRVEHVWPPHHVRERCTLQTREHRVRLQACDSYYLTRQQIHDVDVVAETAASRPTITLFLATETVTLADAFIAPSMADFHEANPDLSDRATALCPEIWVKKLDAVSSYLRGESPTLDLTRIVNYEESYAFFHA